MYINYISQIKNLYKNDMKKLRTGTILFGHLFDSRWQTRIQSPLTDEEILELERKFGILPIPYKEFLLATNGGYLFDLISIAGKQDGYRGMSHEEMVNQPIPLNRIISPSIRQKTAEEGLFIFAKSMVNDSFFALDPNEKVIEINYNKLKIVQEFNSLENLLNEIFIEGKKLVEDGEYIDFY